MSIERVYVAISGGRPSMISVSIDIVDAEYIV